MGLSSIFFLAGCLIAIFQGAESRPSGHLRKRHGDTWIPTWGNMPQLVEYTNVPNPPFNQTGAIFVNSTIRQTLHTSLGGSQIRLQFSNAFSPVELPITEVTVALSGNGSVGVNAIDTKSLKKVTFSGSSNFTVPNGAVVVSDPIDLALPPQSILVVTMYLADGQQSNFITGHPGSRTTSYWVEGNQVSAFNLSGPTLANNQHWYFLTSVDALVPPSSKAFIIVGDSITDGRGSDNDADNRWPDLLLAKMQNNSATSNIAVINKAAGGNRILYDGNGPNALGRIDRDVLAQAGLAYAMIFEGVNDIGTTANDTASQQNIGTRIIDAYKQMASRLQAFDVPFFAATITPFSAPAGEIPAGSYTDPTREATRQRVNAFIRSSGTFDNVIDFDAILRNQSHPAQLADIYNSGDYLHPNVLGYQTIADKFPLGIFN